MKTVLGFPRRADAKMVLKTIRGHKKMRCQNIHIPLILLFFKVVSDYDLNLGRCLNPELTPLRNLASPYFLNRHTFVCGSLFPGIKLN